MVKRVFHFITREVVGLHTAAYIVAVLTLGAQILALVRDRTLASFLGPSTTLDYYYAAFKLPDVYFSLIASLFSVYVLLPFLSKKNEEDRRAMRKTLGEATLLFLVLMGVVCFVTFLFREQVATFFFPSFMESSTSSLFLTFFSLMLLQPIAMGLSGVFASVTQLHKQFFAYALSPIIYNAGIIIGALLVPLYGESMLSYGVIGGAVGVLLFNIVVLTASRSTPIIKLPSKDLLFHLARHSLPRAIALSLSTVTFLILTMYAASLSVGSVTLLSFAMNVGAVPLALIGSAYSIAAFPTLAALYVKAEMGEFLRRITDASRHIILWTSLATVLFIVLRAHIVRVIFGTGQFGWDETRLTSALLAVLVISLIMQALTMLISRGYYAQGKSYTPLMFQLVGFFTTIAVASYGLLTFVGAERLAQDIGGLLRIDGIADTRVIILAFAFSVGQIVTAFCALTHFSFQFKGFIMPILRVAFHSILISIASGIVAYQVLALLGGIFPLTTLSSVLIQAITAGVLGIGVFLALLFIFKNQESHEVRAGIRSLLHKHKNPSSVGDAL